MGPKLNLFNFGLTIHLLNGGVLKTFIDYEKKIVIMNLIPAILLCDQCNLYRSCSFLSIIILLGVISHGHSSALRYHLSCHLGPYLSSSSSPAGLCHC
jgi:hypothetical protein